MVFYMFIFYRNTYKEFVPMTPLKQLEQLSFIRCCHISEY